jgi:hypothetical protein
MKSQESHGKPYEGLTKVTHATPASGGHLNATPAAGKATWSHNKPPKPWTLSTCQKWPKKFFEVIEDNDFFSWGECNRSYRLKGDMIYANEVTRTWYKWANGRSDTTGIQLFFQIWKRTQMHWTRSKGSLRYIFFSRTSKVTWPDHVTRDAKDPTHMTPF